MSCQDCNNCTKSTDDLSLFFSHKEFYYTQNLSAPYHGVINLTNQCTNRCPYCFVDLSTNEMDLDTAIQSVNFIIGNAAKTNNRPGITFFGGEPLLKFHDIIVPLVNYFGSQVDWSITTNGMLLDEDVVDFFYKNQVPILLSMDGDSQTQNRQRPYCGELRSFDIIMKNIPYLLLRFPNTTVRATLTKESIPEVFRNFLFFESMGFKQCFFGLNANEQYDAEDAKILSKQYEQIGLHTYKKLLNKEFNSLLKNSNLVAAYCRMYDMHYNTEFLTGVQRCGLGTTGVGISYKGDIIPCQEENSRDNSIIGDVWSGINFTKHQRFLENYFQKITTMSCAQSCTSAERYFCFNTYCPNVLEQHSINQQFTPTSSMCILSKAIVPIAMKFYILLRDNIDPYIRQIFLQEAR